MNEYETYQPYPVLQGELAPRSKHPAVIGEEKLEGISQYDDLSQPQYCGKHCTGQVGVVWL